MNKAPLSLLFLLLSFNVFTQNKSFYFDGELSAQTKFNLEKGNNIYLGGRYVPELNYKNNMDSISSVSFLASANLSFSKTYISPKSNFSENLIKNISEKDVTFIKEEIQKSLISDFLTVENIYQNNLFSQNIDLVSSNSKIRKNNCIKRDLKLWEVVSTVSY